jgi:hypothetical protein
MRGLAGVLASPGWLGLERCAAAKAELMESACPNGLGGRWSELVGVLVCLPVSTSAWRACVLVNAGVK